MERLANDKTYETYLSGWKFLFMSASSQIDQTVAHKEKNRENDNDYYVSDEESCKHHSGGVNQVTIKKKSIVLLLLFFRRNGVEKQSRRGNGQSKR